MHQVVNSKRYSINPQVKSAKPGQNKFKVKDLETGKVQNYVELLLPESIINATAAIIIKDSSLTPICIQEEDVKRGNKIPRNGIWKFKLRFSVPSKIELGGKMDPEKLFFLQIRIIQDTSILVQDVQFVDSFKIVTHYNQLRKKNIDNKIIKKKIIQERREQWKKSKLNWKQKKSLRKLK